MDGDINPPVFDFDLSLLNGGVGESVDVNEYLNLPQLTPLMSLTCYCASASGHTLATSCAPFLLAPSLPC